MMILCMMEIGEDIVILTKFMNKGIIGMDF